LTALDVCGTVADALPSTIAQSLSTDTVSQFVDRLVIRISQ
jgi:hypothetical protein